MNKPKIILSDRFHTESARGPVLLKINWNENGTAIKEILFEGNSVMKFRGQQTIMITPHEVYAHDDLSPDSLARIYDMGHSTWLKSMDDYHLKKCSHFKVFFYDEIIDVICEGILIEKL